MIKLTKDIINKEIIKKGYIPIDFNLEGYNQHILFKDLYGYKYSIDWNNFKKSKNFKQITYTNPYSLENAKLYLRLNKIDVELLSNKINSVTEILKFKCNKCDNSFYCSWNKIKNRKTYLCENCLNKYTGSKRIIPVSHVEKIFNEDGLFLDDITKYKNTSTYMDCHDIDGYRYCLKYGDVKLKKSHNIVIETNPYSIFNLNLFIKKSKSNTLCISDKYTNEDGDLNFICGRCKKEFIATSSNIKASEYKMCNKCTREVLGINRRIKINDVIKRFEEMDLKLLDFNYIKNDKRLLCEDKFGYRGYVSYNSKNKIINSSRTGFDYFSLKHNKENFLYNANNFCKNNDINTEIIEISEESLHTTPTIKCKCGKCGECFITSINSFKSGKYYCGKCSKSTSSYERILTKYLKSINIKYIYQKRFNDCRNILPLPFDFYLKDYNLIIEVDGEGHYQVCYFNNCSYESALKSFNVTKYNDKIKNEYCKNNSINLLRIPYWNFLDGTYINKINQYLN